MDRRRWAAAYLVVSLLQGAVVLSLPGEVRPALPALVWIAVVFLLLRARRRSLRVVGAVVEGWVFFQLLVGTISWDTQVGLLAVLQAGCFAAAAAAAASDGHRPDIRPQPGTVPPAQTLASGPRS